MIAYDGRKDGGQTHAEYERTENRQPDPPAALKGRLDPKGTWQQNRDFRQSHLKMGTRSFPNKRILRNNLCFPACE